MGGNPSSPMRHLVRRLIAPLRAFGLVAGAILVLVVLPSLLSRSFISPGYVRGPDHGLPIDRTTSGQTKPPPEPQWPSR